MPFFPAGGRGKLTAKPLIGGGEKRGKIEGRRGTKGMG